LNQLNIVENKNNLDKKISHSFFEVAYKNLSRNFTEEYIRYSDIKLCESLLKKVKDLLSNKVFCQNRNLPF